MKDLGGKVRERKGGKGESTRQTALGFTFVPALVNPGRLLSMYLVHGCIYYDFGQSLMTDAEFDELARALFEVWDRVEHIHRHLVDVESLRVNSSCFYLSGKFPALVVGSARRLLMEHSQKNNKHGNRKRIT